VPKVQTTLDLARHYTNTVDSEIHHKPSNCLKAMPHGLNDSDGTPFLMAVTLD